MKKTAMFLTTALTLMSAQSFAEPLTSENLIGNYRATGKVLFKKFEVDLMVLGNSEFEVREVSSSGQYGETCSGIFTISAQGLFKGSASCPSDRSDVVKFNMNLGTAGTEELARGTYAMVSTSKTGSLKIKALVKKY